MIKRPTPPTKSGVPKSPFTEFLKSVKPIATINYDIIAKDNLLEAEAVIAFILKSHEGKNININVKDIEADKVFKKNRNVADVADKDILEDILEISDKFIISGIVSDIDKDDVHRTIITIDCGEKSYQIYPYSDAKFEGVKLDDYIRLYDYIRCYTHLLKIFDGNDYLYRAISYVPKDIIEIIHNKRLAQE